MGFKMKKGGGTANANTPGSFSLTDTNTITALENARARATQLQAQKSADSISYAQDLEKQFRNERGQLNAAGERRLMEDVKKTASEVFDFDIIEPTEKFPKTGVTVKEGTYLGPGYIADGEELGFGSGMSVSQLAKGQKRSGYERTKAIKISELLGLK